MSHTPKTFAKFLLSRRLVCQLQMDEARALSRKDGIPLEDALVRLGHVKLFDMVCAFMQALNLPFGGLDHVTIPQRVLELFPESLARERVALPLGVFGNRLFVALSDPFDEDTLQALQFIVNKDIWPVPVPREHILEAINRHYGPIHQESVDSVLVEFTDTAIDFTEEQVLTDGAKDIFETDFDLPSQSDGEESLSEAIALDGSDSDLESSDFDLAVSDADLEKHAATADSSGEVVLLDEEEDQTAPAVKTRRSVTRRATVRYYHRMNPGRMFPLLVVISKRAIEKAIKKHVAQQQGQEFQVGLDSVVEIEPVLPGCNCYPPREQVTINRGESSAKFYVVPHVTGTLVHARVVVRQEGRVLTEVPLEVRVVKQGLTVAMGGLNLVLPLGLMVLKHFRLDFESQLASGFDLYAAAVQWALRSLSPAGLAGLLLLATAASFVWFRPRKREVFWDIRPIGPDPEEPAKPQSPGTKPSVRTESLPDHKEALFATAEACFLRRDYATALRHYESGLVLGPAPAIVYHHASMAAAQLRNPGRALTILEDAAERLPAHQMKGALWFNMGCFATRLGQAADAVRFLNRAVDAGYTDLEKYRDDPDLNPLRWRTDFKQMLRHLDGLALAEK